MDTFRNGKNSKEKGRISRRTFISRTATGAAFIALAPAGNLMANENQPTGLWPADAPTYRMHMIGHAHIDPVWLWALDRRNFGGSQHISVGPRPHG